MDKTRAPRRCPKVRFEDITSVQGDVDANAVSRDNAENRNMRSSRKKYSGNEFEPA